jgi:hypothetical protein
MLFIQTRKLLVISALLALSLPVSTSHLSGDVQCDVPSHEDGEALATISRPRATDKDLSLEISQLGAVTESPDFWVKIANDAKFSDLHRSRCVMQLFKRHVKPDMTLGEVAKLLSGAKWLHGNEHIVHFIVLGGFVPVEWPSEGSLFSIGLNQQDPDLVVYLSFYGKCEPFELADCLRGEQLNANIRDLRIADCWPR